MRGYWFIAALMNSAAAHACPLCDSSTGQEVRSGIVESFASTALLVVSPFAVFFGIVAWVSFELPWTRNKREND
jgi:hypothetical protein